METIRADRVTKHFGEVRALQEVTVEIGRGELFFLLGSSGCGKTTLLRCFAGLEEPTEGRIFFGERDMTRVPTHQREAAMVFQSYALWPHLTVAQNVAFGLEERGVSKEETRRRVEETLEMVRLEGFGPRTIDQMSGGQQQRVSLARALVVKPKCLLLDEPLSNLDASLRLEMRSEIRRLVKENDLTAIYVTHDQEEALSVADRMAVMEAGRVAQMGTPEEIYRYPVNPHVASFIGETNLLPGELLGVQAATVSLRPEALRLGEKGQLRGRVDERVYLGSVSQYRVSVGAHEVRVAELNPRQLREPGDEVALSFEKEDLVMFSD